MLTFTVDQLGHVVQTVTVKAGHDDDGSVNNTATLTHTASGGDYVNVTAEPDGERSPTTTRRG